MTHIISQPALPLWGGVECTLNRVGDAYFDQMERTGHRSRISDLDLFADLGLSGLRYPIHWEHTAPHGAPDWTWADARLGRLRNLGLDAAVGLIHHGSGPSATNLLDDGFADGLAAFAEAVAKRYPWIRDYTPVNEPLTTARFSGLYGHWHPHGRSDPAFAKILLNQIRGTIKSMQAIRRVNGEARLIQTEEVGPTHSTPLLKYQAEFENERRWLTFDLLCGRVTRAHPLWDYLSWAGADRSELAWIADNPCPPDIIGIDYYTTSERFIDERLERYPVCSHGGNGRHAYADIEAVRVLRHGIHGLEGILRDSHHRYGIPLAVTEAHLCGEPAEQMRWLWEVCQKALKVKQAGIDVRFVTVWSLLGAYDWDTLATCSRGRYEPGVFDVSGGAPSRTQLADMVSEIAGHGPMPQGTLSHPGWWRRPDRLLYPAPDCPIPPPAEACAKPAQTHSKSLSPAVYTA